MILYKYTMIWSGVQQIHHEGKLYTTKQACLLRDVHFAVHHD